MSYFHSENGTSLILIHFLIFPKASRHVSAAFTRELQRVLRKANFNGRTKTKDLSLPIAT